MAKTAENGIDFFGAMAEKGVFLGAGCGNLRLPRATMRYPEFASQILGNIIGGCIGCGSLKSEGFGDGCTAFGALPSPSCA